jgi:NhaP-type Na+/H+ or K+/H+ antiporter
VADFNHDKQRKDNKIKKYKAITGIIISDQTGYYNEQRTNSSEFTPHCRIRRFFLQRIAKMVEIPGIILLLPAGMLVGPVLGLVNPNEIFGDSLFPLVTLGVGILLLKGGFELNVRKLEAHTRKVVVRLVTTGVLITLAIGTLVALLLLKVPFELALLLAAVPVVSGPTVVGPILNIARPREPLGHVLLWEGIVIDLSGQA